MHSSLAEGLAGLAERIRQITVRVHGRGSGHGSGVIWRPDGHIVTSAHVASRLATVVLPDDRAFETEVIACDPERDLAAIKVDAGPLPAAAIGDSDALRVGDMVFAVGHPFGGTGTLTAGIVHRVRRRDGSSDRRWVEADVRVLPGTPRHWRAFLTLVRNPEALAGPEWEVPVFRLATSPARRSC